MRGYEATPQRIMIGPRCRGVTSLNNYDVIAWSIYPYYRRPCYDRALFFQLGEVPALMIPMDTNTRRFTLRCAGKYYTGRENPTSSLLQASWQQNMSRGTRIHKAHVQFLRYNETSHYIIYFASSRTFPAWPSESTCGNIRKEIRLAVAGKISVVSILYISTSRLVNPSLVMNTPCFAPINGTGSFYFSEQPATITNIHFSGHSS